MGGALRNCIAESAPSAESELFVLYTARPLRGGVAEVNRQHFPVAEVDRLHLLDEMGGSLGRERSKVMFVIAVIRMRRKPIPLVCRLERELGPFLT